MAGYTIHVAVANEYIRKNNIVENKDEIIRGVIAPDSVKNKSLTHYGVYSSRPNLKKYLNEKAVKNNYDKGYFLHLLTDYLFYNYYFVVPKDILFYDDYDKTNEFLIKKYNVVLPEEFHKYMHKADGDPEYLKYDLLEKMIDEISNIDIEKATEDILNNDYIIIENKKIRINSFNRK